MHRVRTTDNDWGGAAAPPELQLADLMFPDLPNGRVQDVVQDEVGDLATTQLMLMNDADNAVWRSLLPGDAAVARLGLVPDITGDNVAEIRVALIPIEAHQPMMTWVLSGATGELVLAVRGSQPFNPWLMHENETSVIALSDALETFERMTSLQMFTEADRWQVAANEASNVKIVGGALPTHLSHNNASHNRRGRQHSGPAGPGGTTVTLKKVMFADSHAPFRDIPPQVAYPQIWLDADGDGDADDWFNDPWDNADIRAPICYAAGTKVQVNQVVFTVSPPFAINTTTSTAVGNVVGASAFDEFKSTLIWQYNAAGDELTVTMQGTSITHTTIWYDPNFQIQWRIDTTAGPLTAGTSDNPLYYVLLSPTGSFKFFYSLVHTGCEQAHGLPGTSHTAIADAIFGKFATLSVQRATDLLEGRPAPSMTYYGNWTTPNTTIAPDNFNNPGLFVDGDGQCGAWTESFVRTMHAMGIDPSNEVWKLIPPHSLNIYGAHAFLFVESWNIVGSNNPNSWPDQLYPHLNVPVLCPQWFVGHNGLAWQYVWSFADFTDVAGAPGQGNGNGGNPLATFTVHYIVNVGGKLYDPSYGITATGLASYESQVIAGWSLYFDTAANAWPQINELDINTDINCDGVIRNQTHPTFAFVIRPDPFNVDFVWTPIDWSR
ncbi:MAG: hypothetical protein ACR2GY_10430 [Phycisphaerales bacterium]